MARLDLSPLVSDYVHPGFFLFTRSFIQTGSLLLVYGTFRLDLFSLALDFLHLDLALFLQSLA